MDINKARKILKVVKHSVDAYKEAANKIIESEDLMLQTFFEKQNVDVNAQVNTFKFGKDGPTLDVEFVSSEHQKLRRKTLEKMRNVIVNEEYNTDVRNEEIFDIMGGDKADSRDERGLFGNRMDHPNGSLTGAEVLKVLMNNNIDIKKKNEAFSKYIDELFNELQNTNKPYTDEQFVDAYPKLRSLSGAFMLNDISAHFEKWTGSPIDEDVKKKYKEYSRQALLVYANVNGRSQLIADPSYPYMTNENIVKLGAKCFENTTMFYTKGYEQPYATYNDIIERASAYEDREKILSELINVETLDLFERQKIVSEDTKYFGKNGPINRAEANKLLQEHKYIGIVDESGNLKAISVDNDYITKTLDISEEYDKRRDYKKMLKELNKGTSIINKSSEEYKNMRSILSDLSEGKGNEEQLVASLKENSKTYLNNFYQKPRISDIAVKRRQCVLNMLSQLEELEVNQSLGEVLREYKRNLAIEGQNDVNRNQGIINNDEQNEMESDIKLNDAELSNALQVSLKKGGNNLSSPVQKEESNKKITRKLE